METRPSVSFEDTAIAFSYKSDKELNKANFVFSVVNHPWISAMATSAVKVALQLRLPVESIIRTTVFEHFCGGESIDKAAKAIEKLGQFHVGTILDYSVEGEKTEAGFDATVEETLRTIDKARQNKNIPFSVFKVTVLADAELLTKIQSKAKLSEEEEQAYKRVHDRVEKICQAAYDANVPVLVDAEETWLQDPIDALAYEMMRKFNQERAIVFNTYQMYRTASLKNLKESLHFAAMHNIYLGAKLVRGAYMEKERERAKENNYPDPIQPSKEATDQAFNKALEFCIDNKQRITAMCGSHNDYSNLYLTVLMEKHSMNPNDTRVWFAQLYGMSDNISFNLAQAGYNVAKYVPYGPVRSVMPYLFRRAQENTSVAGQSSRELTLIKKEVARRAKAKN
ncbi:MAG: proline dehydrogenase family protein [Chryseotalea sp.]